MKRGWLKNTALATILSTTLTACGGGGGGGGAVGTVTNFIQNDVSNLSGSTDIISRWSTELSSFQATIENGDISGIQAVITGPDEEDKATAKTLLDQLQSAKNIWESTENLISNMTDEQASSWGDGTKNADQVRYMIYNSKSYKEAYAAMLYLDETVKPIITRVSQGKTITVEQLNLVAKSEKAQEVIKTKEESVALEYVENKKIKSQISRKTENEIYNQIVKGEPTSNTSAEGTTNWTPIQGAGGEEERTVLVITPQTQIIRTEICEWTDVVKLTADGTTTDPINKTCKTVETTKPLDDKIEFVRQTRAGENPIIATKLLSDLITDPVIEFNSTYGTDGTHVDPQEIKRENKIEVTPGAETTSTENYTKTRTEATGTKNQVWVIVDNWTKTTVTKPATSTTYDVVTYKDVKTKQKRTWTIATKRKEVTYKDGTSEIIETPQDKEYTDWTTIQVSAESRTVKENETSTDIFLTPDITDTFVSQVSKTLKNNAYTDDDEDLGTKTVDVSTNPTDHVTNEFKYSGVNATINADKAYARGWTGKGAVLGVIDTYQDTKHKELDGQYLWYNDYVRFDDTVENTGQYWPHGTQVAGIIAAKKDGVGMHGVAYDAKLVGANVDYQGSQVINMSYARNALHDFARLKSPIKIDTKIILDTRETIEDTDPNSVTYQQQIQNPTFNKNINPTYGKNIGGEGYNIVAVNMSFNKNNNFLGRAYGDITKLDDGTYFSTEIANKVANNNGAAYYKIATDNDIIIVNSAGNVLQLEDGTENRDFALDPGVYATEVDNAGNLVLGGKMIIAGYWAGTKEEGQIVGNKAGHVCHVVVDNKCSDKYRVSDFYILAPGNVKSTTPRSEYAPTGGSSFSAPQVTGALGILHQMWPHMKGENLVKLVLNTADKEINNYDVNIHGQGMLDLDEATKPQGAIGIPTTGRVDNPSRLTWTKDTYMATGTAFPSSIQNLKIMVLDDYDRDYYVNLGDSFTVKDNRKYSDTSMLVNNNHTFLPMQQMYGSFAQGGQWDLAQNYNFGFYTGESGNGDYSTNIGKNFFITDRFKLKTSVGTMSEQETWLGNSSDGVLAVGDNNNTNFGNIGVDYQIGNNVLSFDYTRGKTDINTVDDSLIKSFSDVQTESYRLAYEIHKDKHNTLGWSFSLPSHITSGTMDLEVAESVNLDGTINYETIRSDLTQSTKEKNIGFYLNHTPEHDTDAAYNFTAEYRQDVAGQSGKDGINLAMNYTKKFWGSCKFLWMKNPKCYTKDQNGKEVLTAEMNKLMFGHNNTDQVTKLGLRYDLKTDMFVPINPEDKKWKQ